MNIMNGQRILVLEEQASIAELLADMLETANCRVVGLADRLPQALALLAENEVDAAISTLR